MVIVKTIMRMMKVMIWMIIINEGDVTMVVMMIMMPLLTSTRACTTSLLPK